MMAIEGLAEVEEKAREQLTVKFQHILLFWVSPLESLWEETGPETLRFDETPECERVE